MLDQLNDLGYVIIPNILNNEEIIYYRDSIWENLEYVSKNKFNHKNPTTWDAFELFNPQYSMLLHHYSLGHMQPIWDLRQHPSIYNVFENIWSTPVNDLLVSFDGLSVLLPPEVTNKGFNNVDDEWFHTDQSSKRIGRHCIQSMITLYDINDKDATLSVLEGSHRHHQSFFIDKQITNYSDWYLLNNEQKNYFLNNGCKQINICAKAGSMILWDSRTFHQGKLVSIDREFENFRMVVYISMMPRSTIRYPTLLKNRIKAFNNLRTSSHWTDSLFLFPNLKSNELNKIERPILNQIGRRLVGFY